MLFGRETAAAGVLLMAGCGPTGYGGLVPGFGDQRNIELLVEAGFSPVEAIRIATLNGANFMGREAGIGSIAAGRAADLVDLAGTPSKESKASKMSNWSSKTALATTHPSSSNPQPAFSESANHSGTPASDQPPGQARAPHTSSVLCLSPPHCAQSRFRSLSEASDKVLASPAPIR